MLTESLRELRHELRSNTQASWIRFSFGLVSLGELRCDIARYACLLGSDIDLIDNRP